MAIPKSATVVKVSGDGNGRHITCEFSRSDLKAFVPGKFIIVDTGLTSSDGKAIKRAYSLLSVSADLNQFTLLVKNLGETPGADYMHQLKVGDLLAFSGPWGKFNDDGTGEGPIWLIATDTGFTACHGWMESTQRADQVKFFWFRENEEYLDVSVTRALDMSIVEIEIPTVRTHNREKLVWDSLAPWLKDLPSKVFMAGDGDILLSLRDKFLNLELDEDNCMMEMFFNNPAKKSAAS